MWWMLWACTGTVKLHPPGDGTRTTADTGPVPEDDTTPVVLSSTPCSACGGDCLLEELEYDQRYHTTVPIDYADRPPAGGPHHPCWTTFGVHHDEVEDEHWVHNLEHGGVAFLHTCPDCGEVSSMDTLAVTSPFGLSLPYTEMDVPFAMVAWGWRWTGGCWDEDAATAFLADHQDHAPESSPLDPGTGCM